MAKDTSILEYLADLPVSDFHLNPDLSDVVARNLGLSTSLSAQELVNAIQDGLKQSPRPKLFNDKDFLHHLDGYAKLNPGTFKDIVLNPELMGAISKSDTYKTRGSGLTDIALAVSNDLKNIKTHNPMTVAAYKDEYLAAARVQWSKGSKELKAAEKAIKDKSKDFFDTISIKDKEDLLNFKSEQYLGNWTGTGWRDKDHGDMIKVVARNEAKLAGGTKQEQQAVYDDILKQFEDRCIAEPGKDAFHLVQLGEMYNVKLQAAATGLIRNKKERQAYIAKNEILVGNENEKEKTDLQKFRQSFIKNSKSAAPLAVTMTVAGFTPLAPAAAIVGGAVALVNLGVAIKNKYKQEAEREKKTGIPMDKKAIWIEAASHAVPIVVTQGLRAVPVVGNVLAAAANPVMAVLRTYGMKGLEANREWEELNAKGKTKETKKEYRKRVVKERIDKAEVAGAAASGLMFSAIGLGANSALSGGNNYQAPTAESPYYEPAVNCASEIVDCTDKQIGLLDRVRGFFGRGREEENYQETSATQTAATQESDPSLNFRGHDGQTPNDVHATPPTPYNRESAIRFNEYQQQRETAAAWNERNAAAREQADTDVGGGDYSRTDLNQKTTAELRAMRDAAYNKEDGWATGEGWKDWAREQGINEDRIQEMRQRGTARQEDFRPADDWSKEGQQYPRGQGPRQEVLPRTDGPQRPDIVEYFMNSRYVSDAQRQRFATAMEGMTPAQQEQFLLNTPSPVQQSLRSQMMTYTHERVQDMNVRNQIKDTYLQDGVTIQNVENVATDDLRSAAMNANRTANMDAYNAQFMGADGAAAREAAVRRVFGGFDKSERELAALSCKAHELARESGRLFTTELDTLAREYHASIEPTRPITPVAPNFRDYVQDVDPRTLPRSVQAHLENLPPAEREQFLVSHLSRDMRHPATQEFMQSQQTYNRAQAPYAQEVRNYEAARESWEASRPTQSGQRAPEKPQIDLRQITLSPQARTYIEMLPDHERARFLLQELQNNACATPAGRQAVADLQQYINAREAWEQGRPAPAQETTTSGRSTREPRAPREPREPRERNTSPGVGMRER